MKKTKEQISFEKGNCVETNISTITKTKTYTITYSVNVDGDEMYEGETFSFNATHDTYLDTLNTLIKDMKKEIQRDFADDGERYSLSQIVVKVWY